ncbi:hypothetical protein IG9_02870 [Bacillus cereus HuA2-9]|nr:hypothetical protein IG9_02870 [Bacillus cereus HuA2-9]
MYTEISKEIVSITHHDYSGCIDKKGWDDPTAGLNDYSNLAVMEWADTFALYYPTSRLSIIDKGEGMSGIGIQPHIHIPWTSEHIQEDVDLKLALQLLQNEEW